jgi:6-phosphogluconolactonase
MAQTALFGHVAAEFVRPSWDESVSAATSAELYDSAIRDMHRTRQPDLIMLGIGADGHIASLFPGTAALDEREAWYVANDVPHLGEVRLTATFPLLWSAKHVMVLAAGANKAEAIHQAGEGNDPAGRLLEGDAIVEWFLDREAASLLA